MRRWCETKGGRDAGVTEILWRRAGGSDKRTDSGAAEKTRGVRRGWKWRQKIDRRRRALDDDNNNGDGGRQIFRDDGDGGSGWRRGGDAGRRGAAKIGKGDGMMER